MKRVMIVIGKVKDGWAQISGSKAELEDNVLRWVIRDKNKEPKLDDKCITSVKDIVNEYSAEDQKIIMIHGVAEEAKIIKVALNTDIVLVYNSGSEEWGMYLKPLLIAIKKNQDVWIDEFNSLWVHSDKKKVYEMLLYFLPLDIDMQALGVLWNDKKKTAKEKKLLIETYVSNDINTKSDKRIGMLKEDSGSYLEKLRDAQEHIKNLSGLEILKGLFGTHATKAPIHGFLEKLDQMRNRPVIGDDVEGIMNYFNNAYRDEYPIKTFHDWFLAVHKSLDSYDN